MKKIALCILLLSLLYIFVEGNPRGQVYLNSDATSVDSSARDPYIFSSVWHWFERVLGFRHRKLNEVAFASVSDITLSRTEIIESCSLNPSSAMENSSMIEVSVIATNPSDASLIYNYYVSGGRISGAAPVRNNAGFYLFPNVGEGANAIWDLKGVQPGTYTITAGVDDGCGVCGRTITKEVRIAACPMSNTKTGMH